MHIGNCRVAKILVHAGSSINILYGGALDKMEDIPKMARLQTRSHLYGFDDNETTCLARSHSQFGHPYVITEFYMIDIESLHNTILERPWIHMMKVNPSSYHQLL